MATLSTHAIHFVTFTLNLLRLVCFTDSHRLYDNDGDCIAAAVEVVCVAALSESQSFWLSMMRVARQNYQPFAVMDATQSCQLPVSANVCMSKLPTYCICCELEFASVLLNF